MNEVLLAARKAKLGKAQYVMFLLADMMTWCEVGAAFCHKAAQYEGKGHSQEYMRAVARLFGREVLERAVSNGHRIAQGCTPLLDDVVERLKTPDLGRAMRENLSDMDLVARELAG